MGGRGGYSGATAGAKSTQPVIKTIDGVKGSVFTTWKDVSESSPNNIWTDTKTYSHAVFENEQGAIRVRGSNKNDKFELLNAVNTATVHLRGIDPKNYTTREVNRLNKDLGEIRKMGFDTPKINVSSGETVVYAKRNRFTKNF